MPLQQQQFVMKMLLVSYEDSPQFVMGSYWFYLVMENRFGFEYLPSVSVLDPLRGVVVCFVLPAGI